MVKSVFQTIKAALLFGVCTMVFYYGILWVSEEFSQYKKYDEPQGRAIKVSTMADENPGTAIGQRIKLFYWYGE